MFLAFQAETFSVVYIEALACDVPMVATRCDGSNVFVNEENGLIILIGNVRKLSNAMEYMYKNKGNYARRLISQQISNQYFSKIVSNQITRIYKKIIS